MAVRGSQTVASSRLASRYPFLPGAEDALLPVAPSLRELVESPLYAEARDMARGSLTQAARDPATPLPATETAGALGEMRYLSFQYARILLSVPGLPQALVRRWCLYEAKSAWYDLLGETGTADMVHVAQLLGLSASAVEGSTTQRIAFSFPSYVHMASSVREAGFRLSSQEVREGMVVVGRERAARLIQEGIRLYLLGMPSIKLHPAVVELVSAREGDFLKEVARLTPASGPLRPGGFDPKFFPPCIREMAATMARGENLSHFGRFTLAAFLHRVGADEEYIVDCFRGAPDFDEEVTRYQVEHVTHHDGGKGYTPPECATTVTNGLCFKERDDARPSLCADPTLRHPLNYYFRRDRGRPLPMSTLPPDGKEVAKSGGT
jgi:DNA primase large subunit